MAVEEEEELIELLTMVSRSFFSWFFFRLIFELVVLSHSFSRLGDKKKLLLKYCPSNRTLWSALKKKLWFKIRKSLSSVLHPAATEYMNRKLKLNISAILVLQKSTKWRLSGFYIDWNVICVLDCWRFVITLPSALDVGSDTHNSSDRTLCGDDFCWSSFNETIMWRWTKVYQRVVSIQIASTLCSANPFSVCWSLLAIWIFGNRAWMTQFCWRFLLFIVRLWTAKKSDLVLACPSFWPSSAHSFVRLLILFQSQSLRWMSMLFVACLRILAIFNSKIGQFYSLFPFSDVLMSCALCSSAGTEDLELKQGDLVALRYSAARELLLQGKITLV